MTRSCPALLVAAPASGQGKTTLTAALARLHTRAGRRVRVFKCGPDFLDPFWHTLASGAPVHQIDLWMTGEADAQQRLHEAAATADLILVEGVMGLFDGQPSAADLAMRLRLPVLAVIDASSMAGTFGALAFGLQHYRPGLPWAGVVANRVASERHAAMLQEAIAAPSVCLGTLRRDPAWSLPERHLGLTVATELGDAMERLDAAADALEQTPLGQMSLADWQRWSVVFDPPPRVPVPRLLEGRTVAVARDRAFCFIYQANLDVLAELGAQVVFFSPLDGASLPVCDAVWLPGGYPELHVQALSANGSMRASLQLHTALGRSVWAECGGMMALFDTLQTADGVDHPAFGLLPGRTVLQKRLAGLGPQQLPIGAQVLRGHTFHYSVAHTPLVPVAHSSRSHPGPLPEPGEALYQHGSVRASYFHAWFASSPEATAALFLPATAP